MQQEEPMKSFIAGLMILGSLMFSESAFASAVTMPSVVQDAGFYCGGG
jgi:hypothetical protein